MQSIDNTLAEVRANPFAVDNDVKLVAQETTKELDKKVSLHGNNTVEPDGGERIGVQTRRLSKSTRITAPVACSTCRRLLQTITQLVVATSKKSGLEVRYNKVSDGWKIQTDERVTSTLRAAKQDLLAARSKPRAASSHDGLGG